MWVHRRHCSLSRNWLVVTSRLRTNLDRWSSPYEKGTVENRHFLIIWYVWLFTVRNEVAKVMFLHLSVCPQEGLPQCMLGYHPAGSGTPTRADGYCCGRYASYWNAFLFNLCSSNSCFCFTHAQGHRMPFDIVHEDVGAIYEKQTASSYSQGTFDFTMYYNLSVVRKLSFVSVHSSFPLILQSWQRWQYSFT